MPRDDSRAAIIDLMRAALDVGVPAEEIEAAIARDAFPRARQRPDLALEPAVADIPRPTG
jgi:hypothetical protein